MITIKAHIITCCYTIDDNGNGVASIDFKINIGKSTDMATIYRFTKYKIFEHKHYLCDIVGYNGEQLPSKLRFEMIASLWETFGGLNRIIRPIRHNKQRVL